MATRDFEEQIRKLAEEFAERLVKMIFTPVEEDNEKNIERLARLCSALGSEKRIRLLLALEESPRRFGELEILSGLRGGGLKHALDQFVELGLVENFLGVYRITTKGRLVLKRLRKLSKYVRCSPYDYCCGIFGPEDVISNVSVLITDISGPIKIVDRPSGASIVGLSWSLLSISGTSCGVFHERRENTSAAR